MSCTAPAAVLAARTEGYRPAADPNGRFSDWLSADPDRSVYTFATLSSKAEETATPTQPRFADDRLVSRADGRLTRGFTDLTIILHHRGH